MQRERIIFESLTGSRAYGTNRPDSDEDIKGVFVEPPESLLTLNPVPDQWSDEKGDVVYYSLRRFLDLALNANPNIIELLFMPDDCIRYMNPVFSHVLDKRHIFITKQAYVSHVRYAQAQIKKAKGQNKWINNPQPKNPPVPQDFCWIIVSNKATEMPFRPVSLQDSKIDLSRCHVSSVEHAPNVYRLYDFGNEARGVFRGGTIVCESISIEDENDRCIGLLIYNEVAHDRAVRDHRNYWIWRENRNESRWKDQESGQLDYDAKNMMHMFRLMLSAESILLEGFPLVRFSGENLSYLKSILEGRFSYDEIIADAKKLVVRLEKLHEKSILAEEPDRDIAEKLLKDITSEWESTHA